jgi:hypothetical protein
MKFGMIRQVQTRRTVAEKNDAYDLSMLLAPDLTKQVSSEQISIQYSYESDVHLILINLLILFTYENMFFCN